MSHGLRLLVVKPLSGSRCYARHALRDMCFRRLGSLRRQNGEEDSPSPTGGLLSRSNVRTSGPVADSIDSDC